MVVEWESDKQSSRGVNNHQMVDMFILIRTWQFHPDRLGKHVFNELTVVLYPFQEITCASLNLERLELESKCLWLIILINGVSVASWIGKTCGETEIFADICSLWNVLEWYTWTWELTTSCIVTMWFCWDHHFPVRQSHSQDSLHHHPPAIINIGAGNWKKHVWTFHIWVCPSMGENIKLLWNACTDDKPRVPCL